MLRSRKLQQASVSVLILVVVGVVLYAALAIGQVGQEAVFSDVDRIPTRRVALVLGCSPRLPSGAPNPFFQHRVAAAARLYLAGKVSYVLASGDNHVRTYDEPTAMKQSLVGLGVPAERVVLDYAGFSTLDSVARARSVFGLGEICVVSQRDHAARAVYIAKAQGIDAVGYAAQDVAISVGLLTKVREALARVRTLGDVHVWNRHPKFSGPAAPFPPEPTHAPAPTRVTHL